MILSLTEFLRSYYTPVVSQRFQVYYCPSLIPTGTPRAKTIIQYKMVSLKELIWGYIVCPNQTVQLKCDKNKRIEIFRADYGRQHLSMCGRGSTTNCSTDRTTTTKMKELCENKATCRAQAVQGHFKDACPGETKYLDVAYKCKKKKGVSPGKWQNVDIQTSF